MYTVLNKFSLEHTSLTHVPTSAGVWGVYGESCPVTEFLAQFPSASHVNIPQGVRQAGASKDTQYHIKTPSLPWPCSISVIMLVGVQERGF